LELLIARSKDHSSNGLNTNFRSQRVAVKFQVKDAGAAGAMPNSDGIPLKKKQKNLQCPSLQNLRQCLLAMVNSAAPLRIFAHAAGVFTADDCRQLAS
jgi:hypothetical protein